MLFSALVPFHSSGLRRLSRQFLKQRRLLSHSQDTSNRSSNTGSRSLLNREYLNLRRFKSSIHVGPVHIQTAKLSQHSPQNTNNNHSLKTEKRNIHNIYSIPNVITMTRIVGSPMIAYFIINDMKEVALASCVAAAFSDWLDGFIARRFDMKTSFGAYLDPLADKIMIGTLTGSLMYNGMLPMEIGGLILARDAFLLTASIIIRYREKPVGVSFFDSSKSSITIVPSMSSKVNTVFQFALITATMGSFSLGYPTVAFLEPLWWATGVTTMISWAGYLDFSGIGTQQLTTTTKTEELEIPDTPAKK